MVLPATSRWIRRQRLPLGALVLVVLLPPVPTHARAVQVTGTSDDPPFAHDRSAIGARAKATPVVDGSSDRRAAPTPSFHLPARTGAYAASGIEIASQDFKRGRYVEAADGFRKVMLANPDDAVARFGLAHARIAAGDYRNAAFLIRRGMKRLPDWPEIGPSLRDLYGDPNELDQHLKALNSYRARFPRDSDADFVLGYVSFFAGDLDGAGIAFRRVADHPTHKTSVSPFLRRIRNIMRSLGEEVAMAPGGPAAADDASGAATG